jgi:hypothetical protein
MKFKIKIIYHFKVFVFFSGDVAMIEQLKWIARIPRELVDGEL